MTRESKIGKVIRLLNQNKAKSDLISPNYVAEFTYNRGIRLTSEEIVKISNEFDQLSKSAFTDCEISAID